MIEIIPAIDIIDGKCVRLSQGDYDSKKVYNENPVEVAKEFEANGVRRLHVVDLDGAASHHVINHRVLEQIATRTSLIIDFGGGVKSDEDLKIAFESGAQMVTGGSIAVKDPELFCHWLEVYGSEKIILGADVKEHKIAVNGWKDESACELFPFLEDYINKGVRKVICTDISCDGMLKGPSIDLYKEMLEKFPDLYGDVYHKVRINYYPPRKDNKEAWDNIDIFGWMGYPMEIKVNFLCRDSILAAPIALDLVIFSDLALRAGMSGIQTWLSFFCKSPMHDFEHEPIHDLFTQWRMVKETIRTMVGEKSPSYLD